MAAYTNTLADQALGSSGRQNSGGGFGSKGKGTMRKGGGDSGARGIINSALDRFLPVPDEAEAMQNIRDLSLVINRIGLTTVYDVGRETDGLSSYAENSRHKTKPRCVSSTPCATAPTIPRRQMPLPL